MRYVVYVVAVLVAASIVVFLTRSDQAEVVQAPASAVETESDAMQQVAAAPVVTGDKTQLVMHVPKMHCPFACYPAVKKTLAEQAGVAEIELVEQKDENAIDNPRIVVTVGENFDSSTALKALAAAGFDETQVEDEKS